MERNATNRPFPRKYNIPDTADPDAGIRRRYAIKIAPPVTTITSGDIVVFVQASGSLESIKTFQWI